MIISNLIKLLVFYIRKIVIIVVFAGVLCYCALILLFFCRICAVVALVVMWEFRNLIYKRDVGLIYVFDCYWLILSVLRLSGKITPDKFNFKCWSFYYVDN